METFYFEVSLPFTVSNRWAFLDQQSAPWVYFKLWLKGGEDYPLFLWLKIKLEGKKNSPYFRNEIGNSSKP